MKLSHRGGVRSEKRSLTAAGAPPSIGGGYARALGFKPCRGSMPQVSGCLPQQSSVSISTCTHFRCKPLKCIQRELDPAQARQDPQLAPAPTLWAVWWRERVRCTPWRWGPPRPIGVGSTMLIAMSPPPPVGVPWPEPRDLPKATSNIDIQSRPFQGL